MNAWPTPGMRSGLTLMPTGAYQGANRADPDRRGAPPAAALKHEHHHGWVRHRYWQSRGMIARRPARSAQSLLVIS
jgi:hypothetical protein